MSVKIEEAIAHEKKAEKLLKTSLTRWNPDYYSAACEFTKAAECYNCAKLVPNAKENFMRASENYEKIERFFYAAQALENAMAVAKDNNKPTEIFEMATKCADWYLLSGANEKAIHCLDRASRILKESDPQLCVELLIRACEFASLDVAQGCEFFRKCSRLLVSLKRYDEAVDYSWREAEFRQQMNNHGQLGQLAVILVLLNLARGDVVAAEKAYKTLGNSCEAVEINTLDMLLEAYNNEDRDAVKQALSSPFIQHMDVEYSRLAKMIPLPRSVEPHLNSDVRVDAALPRSNLIAGPSRQSDVTCSNTALKEVLDEVKENDDETDLC